MTSPLFGLPNVVCTPHLGASTTEAQENVAIQVAEQMADYLVNGAVSNALNMPSITAEEAPRLTPFVKLAENLGSFAGQLTETTILGVTIEYAGDVADMNTRALTAALLAGLLRPLLHRGQHGQGADRGARARHGGRRGAPDPARRLRDLHPADGEDRTAGAVGRRHGVLRRQAAHHPDQGHQHGGGLRAAHALRHQQATSPASSAASARCSATRRSTSPTSISAARRGATTPSR